jgi:D-alanyl-lipoteichoic acid acyltransferase DltB (MBOAT superfamily)
VNGPVSDPILFEKQWKIAIKPDLEINILKIMLGLFKILVLSGNLNISTESVFSYNAFYSGITSVTASILYSLQLYFEFSGYIELTLAFSNLCGIPLLENFNLPFYAKNMQEFWQRWHISLTQWLTQYIFVPIYKLLSVRINKTLAASLSTMAVFLGMGIWNGFNIGYIISGFLFGIFSVIAFLKNRKRKKVNDSLLYLWVNRIKVFLIFTFCLFFYRVNNWNEITFQIRNMYSDFIPDNFHSSYLAPLAGGGDQSNYFLFTLTITICFGYLFFEKRLSEKNFQSKHFIPLSISIALLIIILGQFGSNRVFEYMQVK